MSATQTVNAFEYLLAAGFSELDTVAILFRALPHLIECDLVTLRKYARDAGFVLPLAATFDVGIRWSERN